MEKENVFEIIRRAESNYVNGTSKLGKYVTFDMHDVIEKITAYINSKHTSGDKDSLGRDKPFFNIVTAAVNIWYRATDIDRKDIIILPGRTKNTTAAFLATAILQKWMNKIRFGVFLNQWGRTLSQYGSAVVKFVEKKGELIPSVIPWNRLIVDPVDFYSLPVIEKVFRTPAQLLKEKAYDKDVVRELIRSKSTRKTLDKGQVDVMSEFVELYEVHGELPQALLMKDPEDKDWEIFVQQMHIVSYIQNENAEYDDFCLYKGREAKNPYMVTHLIEEDGRTLSIGAVESMFDAQWMVNHSMKNMKDTLDLSSKLIFQTADSNFVGKNVLSAIETGDILTHAPDKPLTQINNTKADITALINYGNMWKVLSQELTVTSDVERGITPPSGTPYSTVALLNQKSTSLFEIMVENKGLAIEDMLRTYIIPWVKTKLNTTEEIAAVLQDFNIQKIDSIYVPKEAIRRFNQKVKDLVLQEKFDQLPQFDQQMMEGQVQQELAPLGNQRFFTPEDITWGKVFEGLEWEIDVGVTNEKTDKQAVLQTLTTVLQSVAGNPLILQDPNMSMLFGKILNLTNAVSPVEFTVSKATPPNPEMINPKPVEAVQ